MKRPRFRMMDWLASSLLLLFTLDRILKLASIIHFFRRTPPAAPVAWPSVTVIQPITRGASDLPGNLRSRMLLDYPGKIEHLFVCDGHDKASQAVCNNIMTEFPIHGARILPIPTDGYAPASKLEKMQAAVPHASGEVFCFLDDDIAFRPQAFRIMLPHLWRPRAGAVFGLACYTNWGTVWSSLMSAFVNANALLSYIPITYLIEPFTVTGHCFALRRETFHAIGGFDHLDQRIDDDHELARRVRKAGLRCVQTPMIYDVNNHFASLHAYAKQIKRWFIIPRQTMLPYLSSREKIVTLLGSISQLLPGLLAMLALCTWNRRAVRALVASLGLFGASYALCELCYLRRRTPLKRWPLVPLIALLTPLQIVQALLANEEIEWRGQRLRVQKGGKMEVLS